MKKTATRALALAVVMMLAGAASAQTTPIDDVQVYDTANSPASPYAGQTVTLEGVVYVVKGVYNPGTHYIQGATGGINFYDSAAMPLVEGDRIQVTGAIGSYSGEINITPSNIVFMGNEAAPTPIPWTVSEIMSDSETIGNLTICTGTVTVVNSSNFYITDGDSTIQVYIDSTTGIDISGVEVGAEYTVTSPIVVYNGEIELKPRRQSDLGGTDPIIDVVELSNWAPDVSDPVTVSAQITDNGTINSALLYYRNDSGDSTGVFTSVAMVNTVGDTYEATIPGGGGGRQVDYYITAEDNLANLTSLPGDAPASWLEFAIGFTSVYDVQYAHPDSFAQWSSYEGKVVNIHGLVSAGTGDVFTATKFLVQDGEGEFSGILVYESTGYNFVLPGDEVEIGGRVDEYYSLTEMIPHSGAAVAILSYDNELPEAPIVDTGILTDSSTLDGDSYSGEAWESVFVRTPISTVVDTTGAAQYETFLISTAATAGVPDTLVVDAAISLLYDANLGDKVSVLGFMDYVYGTFEQVPIRDEGVYLQTTGVDMTPQVVDAGGFSRVAPNPFNPKTEIRFVLNRDNLTQLNVYNMRGELVKSLVNAKLAGGQEYVMHWDGTDNVGRSVASGAYFARLRIGSELIQVEKLMLMK